MVRASSTVAPGDALELRAHGLGDRFLARQHVERVLDVGSGDRIAVGEARLRIACGRRSMTCPAPPGCPRRPVRTWCPARRRSARASVSNINVVEAGGRLPLDRVRIELVEARAPVRLLQLQRAPLWRVRVDVVEVREAARILGLAIGRIRVRPFVRRWNRTQLVSGNRAVVRGGCSGCRRPGGACPQHTERDGNGGQHGPGTRALPKRHPAIHRITVYTKTTVVNKVRKQHPWLRGRVTDICGRKRWHWICCRPAGINHECQGRRALPRHGPGAGLRATGARMVEEFLGRKS